MKDYLLVVGNEGVGEISGVFHTFSTLSLYDLLLGPLAEPSHPMWDILYWRLCVCCWFTLVSHFILPFNYLLLFMLLSITPN